MPTANASAVAPKGDRFQLLLKLNSGDTAKLVSIYTKNDSLKREIEKLNLEKGDSFVPLVVILEKDWEGAPSFLAHAAFTPHQVTDESTVVQVVAARIRRVVEKQRSAHPQQVKNESVFKQHIRAVSGVVVEAIFEIRTGTTGTFAPALFGTKCHDLAARITKKKRSTEKDMVVEIRVLRELCEAKNTEIASLNQQHSEFKAMHQGALKTKDAEIASLHQKHSELDAMHQETCIKHNIAIADLAQLKASQLQDGEHLALNRPFVRRGTLRCNAEHAIMSTVQQQPTDLREQTIKLSALLESALNKPRLDLAAMREQILSNTIALVIMNHAHANAQGTILGLEPPPMIITTTEGDAVRAEVVTIVMENYTRRFHMRTEIRGSPAASDAEALLSLYEETKRIMTNAKRLMEERGLFQVL